MKPAKRRGDDQNDNRETINQRGNDGKRRVYTNLRREKIGNKWEGG